MEKNHVWATENEILVAAKLFHRGIVVHIFYETSYSFSVKWLCYWVSGNLSQPSNHCFHLDTLQKNYIMLWHLFDFFYFIHVQYNKMTVKWHVLKSVLLEYKCLRHKDMSVLLIKVVSTEIYFICVQYNKMTLVSV